MGVWQVARIKAWWAKYRMWIVILSMSYVVLVVILILLTGNAEREPFRYQVF
jgi:hypothetical protein